MQKTSKLVALGRRALLGLLLTSCVVLTWPSGYALAQEQPSEQTWGEKTPPKNYVRSKGPNKGGGAYKWKQMAYAGGVMAVMGLFVFGLIRRNRREQDHA